MSETVFRTCSMCFTEWKSIYEFLEDPAIEILGYQADFEELEAGIFLFNHRKCKTTLGFSVQDFAHLRKGPVFSENQSGKEGCPEHCLQVSQLNSCTNTCECRWVRDVIQVIRGWKKGA